MRSRRPNGCSRTPTSTWSAAPREPQPQSCLAPTPTPAQPQPPTPSQVNELRRTSPPRERDALPSRVDSAQADKAVASNPSRPDPRLNPYLILTPFRPTPRRPPGCSVTTTRPLLTRRRPRPRPRAPPRAAAPPRRRRARARAARRESRRKPPPPPPLPHRAAAAAARPARASPWVAQLVPTPDSTAAPRLPAWCLSGPGAAPTHPGAQPEQRGSSTWPHCARLSPLQR